MNRCKNGVKKTKKEFFGFCPAIGTSGAVYTGPYHRKSRNVDVKCTIVSAEAISLSFPRDRFCDKIQN